MNDVFTSKPASVFYWISGAALLWNITGIVAYVSQVSMSPETLASLPEAQRALYEDVPAWATTAYAVAVNAGALGCLLLLFRKALALPVLVVSLVGVLVQFGHAWFMTPSIEVMGASSVVFPLVIIGIGIYLIWVANDAKSKGWIS
jgi:hypothetical protein